MDDNNLNHLIAVNVLVPDLAGAVASAGCRRRAHRVASESSRLSVCEAERDEARRERDAYRKSWEREAQDAARYRLHHEACVTQRDEARKAAAGWVEDVSTMAARVDDMAGDLRACRAALDWYAKEDRYDVGRASRRPVVLADRGLLARRALAALSGVVPTPSENEHDLEVGIKRGTDPFARCSCGWKAIEPPSLAVAIEWADDHAAAPTPTKPPTMSLREWEAKSFPTERIASEYQRLRNAVGDVRGMHSDGATAEEMDAALGEALTPTPPEQDETGGES